MESVNKGNGLEERDQLMVAAQKLVDAMKSTSSYRSYKIQCEKINKQPEMKRRVDEYRSRNFDIQNSNLPGEEVLRKQQQLQQEYSDVLYDIVVTDFLAAELDLCRMVQEINLFVTESLDFE